MHPNVPFPYDTRNVPFRMLYSSWSFLRYRLPFFVMSLIVPEWILSLAVQQWLATRKIMKEGGFYAYRVQQGQFDEPCYPLSPETMIELVRMKHIQLPTDEEIEDRNKSNWLAKIIVLIQTGWFVTQCVARGANDMPLTELEIVTLAYTIVNFGTSLAWWSKPRNVSWPIPILMPGATPLQQGDKKNDVEGMYNKDWEKAARWLLPGFDADIDVESRKAVPTFYSGKTSKTTGNWALSNLAILIAGIAFGGIHCLAWSYPFPSRTEQILWRYSAIVMIIVPIVLCLSTVAVLVKRNYENQGDMLSSGCADAIARPLFYISLFPGAFMYVSARVITLFLAFKTLDALPDAAFRTVPFTKLIPHV
ncbi:7869_t:CDS:2 [Acaulospora colombiana]|uniref:7869_t:CDS:1 n=1 Tax=Acaulospora colombiana TaxID=27376 RepID=A0ACA9NVH4_9GLOM|nr:7869_t:CDS:2 [Acaulospora colombiana]